jgi:hypothetical protein
MIRVRTLRTVLASIALGAAEFWSSAKNDAGPSPAGNCLAETHWSEARTDTSVRLSWVGCSALGAYFTRLESVTRPKRWKRRKA